MVNNKTSKVNSHSPTLFTRMDIQGIEDGFELQSQSIRPLIKLGLETFIRAISLVLGFSRATMPNLVCIFAGVDVLLCLVQPLQDELLIITIPLDHACGVADGHGSFE